MSYTEMKAQCKEDWAVYYRTGSIFYLTRAKLLESAIADAVRYGHSDCTD